MEDNGIAFTIGIIWEDSSTYIHVCALIVRIKIIIKIKELRQNKTASNMDDDTCNPKGLIDTWDPNN